MLSEAVGTVLQLFFSVLFFVKQIFIFRSCKWYNCWKTGAIFLNIISRMNQSHFFSHSENNIIRYLLENPDEIKNATTKELAIKTFTSASTIVRLAQKLGFQGYNDFKMEFLAAVQQIDSPLVSIDANFPFKKTAGITEISSNLSQLFVDAIKETNALVDEKK